MPDLELGSGPAQVGPTVDFCGSTFRLDPVPNEFALAQWSAAAEEVDEHSTAAFAATFRLLQAAILEEDWPRFKQTAFANKATITSLLPVAFSAFEQATERPTERPSDSSDGPEPTPLRFVSQLDDPAMDRLAGRPDLQLSVLRSRRTASA